MKYMLLIHQGDTPTPRDPEAWGRLSEEQQQAVYEAYRTVSETPGVNPGLQLAPPETATTVRVQDGKTLITGRLGRTDEAREAYRRALALVHDEAERRLLERRLADLTATAPPPI